MQITETSAVGLNRELKIVIPSSQSIEKMDDYLKEATKGMNVRGFRPGKVPTNVLRTMFGKQVAGKVLEELVNETTQKAVEERKERLSSKPEVNHTGNPEEILLSGEDLSYEIKYEIYPEIELPDISTISVERPVIAMDEQVVEDYIKELAGQNRTYHSGGSNAVSEIGDQVELSYIRKGEGSSIEVGNAEKIKLVLGNPHFFKSDEQKLIGKKIGDVCELELKMSHKSESTDDSSQVMKISATILDVSKPEEVKIDDKFASSFGFKSLEDLKRSARSRNQGEYENISNRLFMEQVVGKLLDSCQFQVPESATKAEYEGLWKEYKEKRQQQGSSEGNPMESEAEAGRKIKDLAEKRIRMQLIFEAVALQNRVVVSKSELDSAVDQAANQLFKDEPDEKAVENAKSNEQFVSYIKRHMLIDKGQDFLFSNIKSVDKAVSEEEMAEMVEKQQNSISFA